MADVLMPEFTRGDWLDIGDGNKIRRVFREGELDALDWDHGCTNPAEDFIPLRSGPAMGPFSAAAWLIEQAEPLTISPSLLCTACQRHGWIKNGVWVPA